MNKTIFAILIVAMMMLAPVVSAEEIEIRSEVATDDIIYDYRNAAFLWMDLDKNISSEVITITTSGTGNRTIAEGALTYVCVPQIQTYKNPALRAAYGPYEIVGFLGSKYMVYDHSNELVKMLINWGGSKDKIIATGDSFLMPEGYEFKIREIDLEGDKAAVEFLKDGVVLDSEIVVNGDTYVYEDDEDVVVFSVQVASVFRGTDSNIVEIKFVFLLSDTVMKVKSGDNYGKLEVTNTNPITLKNDGVITLGQDDDIDLTDDLVIRVADHTDLLYYIAKIIEVPVCPECPEVADAAPCPEPEPCDPCPVVAPEVITVTKYVNVTVPAEPVAESPGFEAVFAIAGLLAIAYLIARQKD